MSAVLKLKSVKRVACMNYQHKFREFFGDQVTITPALCEAVAPHFPWPAAAWRFLTDKLIRRFERQRDKELAAYSVEAQRHEAQTQNTIELEQRRVAQRRYRDVLMARHFAELFNSPENARKRAALTRLARK